MIYLGVGRVKLGGLEEGVEAEPPVRAMLPARLPVAPENSHRGAIFCKIAKVVSVVYTGTCVTRVYPA